MPFDHFVLTSSAKQRHPSNQPVIVILPFMSLPKSFPLRVAGGKTIQIPSVGYGTWASGENSWAKDAVVTALKAGYRHLDCAWMYGVDEAVGEAIKESGIPREEIFVTTKASIRHFQTTSCFR